jgi:predicted membrane GTPase involved in stress response
MNRLFHGYAPYKGDIQGRRNGVLISNDRAKPSPMRCGTWKTAAR